MQAANNTAIATANQVVNGPMGLQEVASMAQQQISDGLIINQIRSTGTTYNLGKDEILYLKQQGVSDAVVAEMQSRRTVVQVVQPGYPRAVYVEPVVGVYGGGYGYRHY